MTEAQAKKIVAMHQNEIEYSTCSLQIGKVNITGTYENGFIYERITDYVVCVGIYEELFETHTPYDPTAYRISEVITKRF